jgi:hypothetical protein
MKPAAISLVPTGINGTMAAIPLQASTVPTDSTSSRALGERTPARTKSQTPASAAVMRAKTRVASRTGSSHSCIPLCRSVTYLIAAIARKTPKKLTSIFKKSCTRCCWKLPCVAIPS